MLRFCIELSLEDEIRTNVMFRFESTLREYTLEAVDFRIPEVEKKYCTY